MQIDINNVLGDDIGHIQLLDCMGNDLSIINNARVSYAKFSAWFKNEDEKLLKYLIKHKHWSPFRSVILQYRVKAPLFLVNQWKKHIIASTYIDDQIQQNQESFRYLDLSNSLEFYKPRAFRGQHSKNKQASKEDFTLNQKQLSSFYNDSLEKSKEVYCELILRGVCREQARAVLPNATYTSFICTQSLQAAIHLVKLRQATDAQSEFNAYATELDKMIKCVAPITHRLWNEKA